MTFSRSTSSLMRTSLLIFLAMVLTSCGDSASMSDRMDAIGTLPLWQRVSAIALATLLSEDLACITAGLLASEGVLTFGWALTAAFLGIYVGDMFLYLMGRIGGIALLRRAPFRWMIKESQIKQAESLFEEHGAKIIFSSRLLPGSRLPIYAAAGVLNYPLWRFALFMFLAGGLSAAILVGGSRHLGEVVIEWLKVYEAWAIPVFATAVFLIWTTVKLLEIFATRRSRLVFLARSRKIWNKIATIFRSTKRK